MMRIKSRTALCLVAVMLLLNGCGPAAESAPVAEPAAGVFSPNAYYEYLVGSAVWQLSAESQALMQQAFALAEDRVREMAAQCADPEVAEWAYAMDEDGARMMTYQGRPVAIISDIDDTLVDGAHYTANIVGRDGDMNNVAFARFVLSDGCTALPGAVDFVRFCADSGVQFYYVTNRYERGYRVGEADSAGSYQEAVGAGEGLYRTADGTEIGCTIYQALGKSFYDITLESMARLGFPIDDQHLIVNDSNLNGPSKEAARTAVRDGAASYPNGQRADGNYTGCALTLSCPPHHVAMMLGDNLNDFTDAFSAPELDAVSRAQLTEAYADKWGREWIVLPNAVYGDSMDYAAAYGMRELLHHYDYEAQGQQFVDPSL
ncbi:MAG: HAD family acid phosphatase [Syntrophomonadaceae bacterium]|nr:HAD family acid phosphatase [Syntrophomonadaceae bacterium]